MMLLTELEKEKIMEIFSAGIFAINRYMRKILSLLGLLMIFGAIDSSAQSEKTVPPPPPSKPPKVKLTEFKPPILVESVEKFNAFLKRNPAIKDVYRPDSNIVILGLKSGKEEKYNFGNEVDRNLFFTKYGELPVKPPPPPLPKKRNQSKLIKQ
jgi:hypothetical protein